MFCPQKTKGAYVYDSLPSKTPGRTGKPDVPLKFAYCELPVILGTLILSNLIRPEQITLMHAPSGEDGPAHFEAVSRKRYKAMTSRCAGLRNALAKQRAATARKFMQDRRAGDTKNLLIGPGCNAFTRSSVHVQTGLFLEELTEEIEQDNFGTQTDYFLDRPPTPLFVPAKTGVDVATQIYQDDLFDFNLEVQPILEVLVGKTIEQALLEVLEEEELADLRWQQEVLQEIHNADLAEVARLEDRNRRYEEEKKRRKIQYETAARLAKETADKIAAKAFTKAYLSPLILSTFQQLLDRGYFYDSVEHDLELNFLEPLIDGVLESNAHERRARLILDGMLRQAVTERHVAFRELGRLICERECLEEVVPLLRGEVSSWIIERSTRLAISRLELAAASTKEIMDVIGSEVINEAMGETALEVQAQKEAEEAAANAENTEEEEAN
ncbi:Flagellar radial spoke protein 3 [Fasciola gigantica]|uniref:Flagellar radial spoke protein 3 n=1 Tax=Fasciola gigantica TaxID=46835 RepID=A0A504ZDS9_FASGI|nr:Flagellar radial spoke protein 3 [Fasciola gigantica]